jgi:hypothetical protein
MMQPPLTFKKVVSLSDDEIRNMDSSERNRYRAFIQEKWNKFEAIVRRESVKPNSMAFVAIYQKDMKSLEEALERINKQI